MSFGFIIRGFFINSSQTLAKTTTWTLFFKLLKFEVLIKLSLVVLVNSLLKATFLEIIALWPCSCRFIFGRKLLAHSWL